jgi:mannose-6-phosphate isomerase-like protein (cupin superfamily)
MKLLQQWIVEGKIAQFVAGGLDAAAYTEIFEAAKVHAEVRAAIAAAKADIVSHMVGLAKAQDPRQLIASGLLEQYAEDRLDDAQRQHIELMAMAHPQVSLVMDVLKRERAERLLLSVREMNPKTLIDSPLLMDYVLGECSPADRLMVEIARTQFPEVSSELEALESVDAALVMSRGVNPPAPAKARFATAMQDMAMPADGWGLIMPPLGQVSQADDFKPWVDAVDASKLDPAENLNVFPLDATRNMLTLFVVVRDRLDEEVHVDSIERFLVLEGSCVIEMGNESVQLQQGDFYSIPKFTPHTVIVTSATPCKLIVQQVAA